MIFYFSGTGNSKWIAEQIAHHTNDELFDISKLAKVPNLELQKRVGLVFPIYAWGVAEPMLSFVKKLPKTSVFTYGVCTCGEDAGLSMKKLSKIYRLDSCYSVVMPNNYIVGSDIDDQDTISKKIADAKIECRRIASEIIQTKKVHRVNEGTLALLKTNLACMGFNRFARTTKPFYATEKCNGCGLCANNCPASTITLVESKPVWSKKCYQCLRCINVCPKRAIQYGKATENRDRYTIQKYL
ncbi:MAG: EFR1 family ferrodoxin [Angelakisella sp.]|nr:EFR1 family ferrodoxin [Angelakisella sp.]